MSSRKVVIITGANGLLGRRLVAMLSPINEVWALVRTRPPDPIPDGRYLGIDFAREWDVDALPKRADAIIHLAQSAHFRNVPEHALDVFRVNIASTAMLLDYGWRSGVKSFIYASSGGIYGGGGNPFRENAPIVRPGALGYYLGSKASGEALASSYAKFFEIQILRYFFMYGHGQNRQMLIPRLVDNIRQGRPVAIQGATGLRMNPIHVDDAAAATVAALKCEGSAVYNIAGPQVVSLRDLCEEISGLVALQVRFDMLPGDPSDIVGDIALMSRHLRPPTIRPATGLKDVL